MTVIVSIAVLITALATLTNTFALILIWRYLDAQYNVVEALTKFTQELDEVEPSPSVTAINQVLKYILRGGGDGNHRGRP